jgi:hypothetical protein
MKMRITIQVFFAWYDMWIGAYWSQESKTLYICPIPMIVFSFKYTNKRIDFDEL